MTNDKVPVDERFSHVYIARGKPTKDSQRFRHRLGAFFNECLEQHKSNIVSLINRELGVKVPWTYGWDIPKFFMTAELRDVLDTITLIWRELSRGGWPNLADRWLEFVERSLREENLGRVYKTDTRRGFESRYSLCCEPPSKYF